MSDREAQLESKVRALELESQQKDEIIRDYMRHIAQVRSRVRDPDSRMAHLECGLAGVLCFLPPSSWDSDIVKRQAELWMKTYGDLARQCGNLVSGWP